MALDLLLVGAIVVTTGGHEQVEQAIAVVIDQADAAAERFEDGEVSSLLAIVVGGVDLRAPRHVLEERWAYGGRFGDDRGGRRLAILLTGGQGQQHTRQYAGEGRCSPAEGGSRGKGRTHDGTHEVGDRPPVS